MTPVKFNADLAALWTTVFEAPSGTHTIVGTGSTFNFTTKIIVAAGG